MNATVVNLQINSIQDRRGVVNKLQDFDEVNGIKKSQRAKHERTVWEYIACILTSADNKKWTSIQYIIDVLAIRGIKISYMSIYRMLNVMNDTQSAIHPHRRSCGVSCHEVVQAMRGIRFNKIAYGEYVYAFGASPQLVNHYRRVFQLTLDPK
jgi:hypothetical protein